MPAGQFALGLLGLSASSAAPAARMTAPSLATVARPALTPAIRPLSARSYHTASRRRQQAKLNRKHGGPQDHHRAVLCTSLTSSHAPGISNYGLEANRHLPKILAIGFLLVILSCAVYPSRLPLLVAGTYVLAPVPDFICARCAAPDDFISGEGGSGGGVVEFGRFLTGFLVIMGIGAFLLSRWSGLTLSLTRGCHSATRFAPALQIHRDGSHGHEHLRRIVDLRHDNQLHDVLPGRRGGLLGG